MVLSVLISVGLPLFAQSFGSVQKLDLDDERPPDPKFRLLVMNLKKLKATRGNIILRQFSKRVRVEFDGAGLPNGKYSIALSAKCPDVTGPLSRKSYEKGWTELHQFPSTSSHVETEKSLPTASLKDMESKSLSFFRVVGDRYSRIDCKAVSEGYLPDNIPR